MEIKTDLNAAAKKAHVTAIEKGWWENPNRDPFEVVTNFHGEISEAWEDYRNGKMELTNGANGKPEGFPSEMADILIRVFDIMQHEGEDLDNACIIENAYKIASEDYALMGLPHIFLEIHATATECIIYNSSDYDHEEMNNLIVCVLALCIKLNIDIDYALEAKQAYNETRPYRHGGKKA